MMNESYDNNDNVAQSQNFAVVAIENGVYTFIDNGNKEDMDGLAHVLSNLTVDTISIEVVDISNIDVSTLYGPSINLSKAIEDNERY